MKKRLLLSTMVVAMVCALVGGATFALFTSTDSNTGNSFTAGSVVVALDKGPNDAYFNVTDMAPGDSLDPQYIEVRNDGSLDMFFKMYIDNVEGLANYTWTDTAGVTHKMSDYLKVTVTLNPSDYGDVQGYSKYGPANHNICTDLPLTNLIGMNNALNNLNAEPMAKDFVAVYKLDVEFDVSAPNELQAKNFTGKLMVNATQADNQTAGSVQW